MSERAVGDLLRRVADSAGPLPPAPVEALVGRARRRLRLRRAALAATAAVCTVAALLVPVAVRAALSTRSPAAQSSRMDVAALERGRWHIAVAGPLGVRSAAAVVPTDDSVLVWGGRSGDVMRDDGATYRPSADRWEPVPAAPLSARSDVAAVWTGRTVVLIGGQTDAGWSHAAAGYDPTARTWSTLPALPIAAARHVTAVWTGASVLVAATTDTGRVMLAALDPVAGTWTVPPAPDLPASHAVNRVVVVPDGGSVTLFAAWSAARAGTALVVGLDVRRRDGGDWHGVDIGRSTLGASPVRAGDRTVVPPVTTGSEPGVLLGSGASTDLPPGPLETRARFYLWSGAALVAAAAGPGSGGSPGRLELAAWEPTRSSWARLPSAAAGTVGSLVRVGDRLVAWTTDGTPSLVFTT